MVYGKCCDLTSSRQKRQLKMVKVTLGVETGCESTVYSDPLIQGILWTKMPPVNIDH